MSLLSLRRFRRLRNSWIDKKIGTCFLFGGRCFLGSWLLAVDWKHAVESGVFIVCDRCRALPW
jgi:hypothetical protein